MSKRNVRVSAAWVERSELVLRAAHKLRMLDPELSGTDNADDRACERFDAAISELFEILDEQAGAP